MDEKLKKATEELSEKTEQITALAKNKIVEQLNSEQLKKTAQAATDKSKETLEKAKNMAENIDKEEINKNVKEIGKKTKKELGKHTKKELATGAVILILLFAILSKIGWGNIFGALAIASACVLIYDFAKKKQKKYAVMAVVVFTILAGLFPVSKGVDDNVLNYMGTKESDVYRTYNKSEFKDDGFGLGTYSNETTNQSGLPHITIYNNRVVSISLESGMNASFNVNGIHIGDSVSTANKCLEKLNAVMDESNSSLSEQNGKLYGQAEFLFSYQRKDMRIIILINGDLVNSMRISEITE